MLTAPPYQGWRHLHPIWTVVTVVIVVLGCMTIFGAGWRIVVEREWWNIPGAVLGGFFTYWLGIAAWRCACLGRSPRRTTRPGVGARSAGGSGHTRAR